MKTPDIQEEERNNTLPTPPQRLPLDSLQNARRSFSRLITAYYRGVLDERKFKMMIYGMNVLLGYLKEVETEELEKRIAALEARIVSTKEKHHA